MLTGKKRYMSADDVIRAVIQARNRGMKIYIYYKDIASGTRIDEDVTDLSFGRFIELFEDNALFYEEVA